MLILFIIAINIVNGASQKHTEILVEQDVSNCFRLGGNPTAETYAFRRPVAVTCSFWD